ncbi:hypothetical protein HHL11_17390 [Ramlibacter sp. G-1-2-2]|uniref:Thioesterase domain-containing protein n=1 Tax=Ramlibacter agri TaxID=2728837 RepID=A0A848H837_9BURK|nr:thioesterase domain-containing protein [Ramlibacter agri]NML45530.1 hypothetical protein [Ramlibacter agri]
MNASVRHRHVFFLSGFDPKGASYYHGLYARNAPLQGEVTGTRYEVGPRTRLANGNSCWQVRSGGTETSFEFVRWDDIVRAHWPRSAWQVLVGSLRGYAAALASPAALRKVGQAAPRTLIALAYPAVFWLVALLLALLAVVVLGPLGVVAAAAILWGAWRWERRLNTSWLLRIYRFAADWRGGRTPQLQQRIDDAAAAVVQRLLAQEDDEVLLVGYSVGSLLAASIAARVQARGLPLERFSFVTLGHCVPLLGLMAGADAFRADLARLGLPPRLHWVDFSSPTDWGSFALVDPLALSLGAPQAHGPRMASPRFHTMFPPDEYALLVRDKRRIHLQYLLAGHKPALYDYFAITAGPQRLAERMDTAPAA